MHKALSLFAPGESQHIVKTISAELCLRCRFAKLLCGRPVCPILLKLDAYNNVSRILSKEVSGDTPPAAFVGTSGYPNVSVGPLLPPLHGDTRIYDEPELWYGLGFQEIVNLRTFMVRGKERYNVNDANQAKGLLYDLQISNLAIRPVSAEMVFSKQPSSTAHFDDDSPPFGPSAWLKKYRLSSQNSDRRLEYVFYDRDLGSTEGIITLYTKGISVNSIQRLLSVGMLGRKRRLVPTRWSITAVDDAISKWLLERVKQNTTIDDFRVFIKDYLGSRYVIIMLPFQFSFEWIEAWYPKTTFNPSTSEVYSIGDFEGQRGRKSYAAPGGCYYSVRLAVSEYLDSIRRQAAVIALREIYPGQILPLGVWNVREAIRHALKSSYKSFDSIESSVNFALSNLRMGERFWRSNSRILRQFMLQNSLDMFIT